MTRIAVSGVCGLALALSLGACGERSLFAASEEERILARGWTVPRPLPEPPVACYSTLADPDCFLAPIPGQEHRRLGS